MDTEKIRDREAQEQWGEMASLQNRSLKRLSIKKWLDLLPIDVDKIERESCPECKGAGWHSSWCSKKSAADRCPTCGIEGDEPGFTRPQGGGLAIPCPDCYAPKMQKRARRSGQLEGELRRNTFDNFGVTDNNRRAFTEALQFCDNPTGWLTIFPGYGAGKTHLCAAIANRLGPDKCRYYNTPDLTGSLKDFNQTDKIIAQIAKTPVIILDELDKAYIVNWTREQIQRIIEHRYRNFDTLGLVISTNNRPEDFSGDLQFIGQRMRDERFRCIELLGNGRGVISRLRQLAGKQKMNR